MISARSLARRYDAGHLTIGTARCGPADFDAWLAAFWRTDCPPEPDTCPDAVSFLGGANGGAVRWYEADGEILGYLPGSPRRCFWVPRSAALPSFDDALDDEGPPCGGDEHDLPRGMPPPWLAGGSGAGLLDG